MTDDLRLGILTKLTDADAAAIHGLLGQLSSSATFDRARIQSMITHDATELVVVRQGEQIVGMATLVTFPLPTGLRGFVEDVVTDESVRGQGIGLRSLDLTARSSREAALRLYEAVGFVRRDTNVLRFVP
ncbi:GNAT family N-acetyltransferase [Microbacterium resistens]|uniref:GNAT family N-acetyltransferase n=1 Tax=Microbacterium resistens TaxID=156977 RepID=UPI000833FC92|nr:GNAT family N-acetyltransferase [Microbacterium resistens]